MIISIPIRTVAQAECANQMVKAYLRTLGNNNPSSIFDDVSNRTLYLKLCPSMGRIFWEGWDEYHVAKRNHESGSIPMLSCTSIGGTPVLRKICKHIEESRRG